jgi:hypothetical protein
LNLRPPGYEPGELPGCSTPRRGVDCSTAGYDPAVWDWAIWGALIVGALAGGGALALLVARVLAGWRELKRVRGTLVGGLDELAARGDAAADKLAAAGETDELQEGVARLRTSLAQLAVLREAIDEVQDTAGRLTAVMPRK